MSKIDNIIKLKKYILNLEIKAIGHIKVKDLILEISLMNNFDTNKIIGGDPFKNIEKYLKNCNYNEILYIFQINDSAKKWTIYKSLKEFHIFQKRIKSEKTKVEKLKEIMWNNLHKFLTNKKILIKNSAKFLSFIENNGYVTLNNIKSIGEVIVKKKPGGQYKYNAFKKIFNKFLFMFNKRTFIFLKYGFFYIKLDKYNKVQNKEMLFFNENTRFEYFHKFNYILINIKFDNRELKLKFEDIKTYIKFHIVLNSLDIFGNNKKKRYNSFAPIRNNINISPILLGDKYFNEVFNELSKAKRVVYILDWWLCAHLYLKRPIENNQNSRLDRVLLKLASKGVKIFIILYREMKVALSNNSLFTMNFLNKLHKNIFVIRHPNGLINYWSHHEKVIIIDNKLAFVGGIDLCFGRYETNSYPLSETKNSNLSKETIFYGKDYSNTRIQDFYDIDKFSDYQFDISKTPRMPWRDIAIKLKGNVVKDLCFHFIEYWNHAKDNDNSKFIYYEKQSKTIIKKAPIKDSIYAFRNNSSLDKKRFKINTQNKINLKKSKRNKSMNKMEKFKNLFKIKINMNFKKKKIEKVENVSEFIKKRNTSVYNYSHNNNGQILRSVSDWSIGFQRGIYENSIYRSYIDLINNANKFIYIENQFFITNTTRNNDFIVNNLIGGALYSKLNEKIKNKETFKLIVMMPLLPGFEGDLESDNRDVFLMIMNFQLESIFKREDSFLKKLINNHGKEIVKKYIIFLSMRNHTIMGNGKPATEIIYIHSKLMIVDDKKMIIGSANINDRSMLGKRDSEIAILIENKNDNNQIYEFRLRIWENILGIELKYLMNPLDDIFFDKLYENCKYNEKFYREVFGIFPDNKMKDFNDCKIIGKKKDINKYDEMKKNVKGYIIRFPYKFWIKENLNDIKLNFTTKLVPKEIYI